MEPEKILHHIDNQVVDRINMGLRWDDIIDYLKSNVWSYKNRDSYINVSEKYLINNWSRIEWKKRMTTMLAIQSLRRVDDIKWIMKNHKNFKQYDSVKIYKLISLKDKLKINNVREN